MLKDFHSEGVSHTCYSKSEEVEQVCGTLWILHSSWSGNVLYARDTQSQEKSALPGTDLCSEYQFHISPAILMTLFHITQAASASKLQNQSSHIYYPQSSPGPSSQTTAVLCVQRKNAGVILTPLPPQSSTGLPPAYFSNVFTTLQLHYHHPFQTTMILWLGCSYSLLTDLPAPHS